MNRLVNFRVDHWRLTVGHVPGLKKAVFKLIEDLCEQPLTLCPGDQGCIYGYCEGTRWLHIFGVPEQVEGAVLRLIRERSQPYERDIEAWIEEEPSSKNVFLFP